MITVDSPKTSKSYHFQHDTACVLSVFCTKIAYTAGIMPFPSIMLNLCWFNPNIDYWLILIIDFDCSIKVF